MSVFEGVVYHCWVVDPTAPCRPTLEVDALLRPGDADAEAGPLLLSVSDFIVFAGGIEVARPCLRELADAGRIVRHLDVDHIAFPTWTRVVETRGDEPPREHQTPPPDEAGADPSAAPAPHPSHQDRSRPDRPTFEVLRGGADGDDPVGDR